MIIDHMGIDDGKSEVWGGCGQDPQRSMHIETAPSTTRGFSRKTLPRKTPGSLLWGLLLLFLAVAGCAGRGLPPPQEDVQQLVEAAWEKSTPVSYLVHPPCKEERKTGFAITNVEVAKVPRYGPRGFYWPVTVEVEVTCSPLPPDSGSLAEVPLSLLNVPPSDRSDLRPTDLAPGAGGVWIAEGIWKNSYVGNLVKDETNTWEVRWP